jgi:multiple sugar transport system substrate-binding protein
MIEAYQAKFNKPLEVPKTWEDYAQVAQFITDQMAPDVYGRATSARRVARQPVRLPAAVPHQRRRTVRRRHEGADSLAGRRQDHAGHDRGECNASIPGNSELDAVSVWAPFLQGKLP